MELQYRPLVLRTSRRSAVRSVVNQIAAYVSAEHTRLRSFIICAGLTLELDAAFCGSPSVLVCVYEQRGYQQGHTVGDIRKKLPCYRYWFSLRLWYLEIESKSWTGEIQATFSGLDNERRCTMVCRETRHTAASLMADLRSSVASVSVLSGSFIRCNSQFVVMQTRHSLMERTTWRHQV